MGGGGDRVNERELTERLRAFFPSHADVTVPIGDDAAVVRHRGGAIAMCCDPVVGGVHFDGEAPLRLVGRKAVNRNLSDLAAMGAKAQWLLCSLVAPPRLGAAALMEVLRGVRDAARAAAAVVVGGDVAVARAPLSVTVSAFGRAPASPLRRDGLAVGDALHVTGPLGGAMEGHHLRFRPALREGAWLAGQPAVQAAIDVSDGLALDLATALQASGDLGAILEPSAIPIRAAAHRLAGGDRAAGIRRALHDGEDHCLLFGVRRGATLGRGGPLTARARASIGRVIPTPGIYLARGDRLEEVPIRGFQHEVDA